MGIGKVEVRVQTEERIYAINKLASAIEVLARALNTGVYVSVQDCHIDCHNSGAGINVGTESEVTRTEIVTDETEDHEAN